MIEKGGLMASPVDAFIKIPSFLWSLVCLLETEAGTGPFYTP